MTIQLSLTSSQRNVTAKQFVAQYLSVTLQFTHSLLRTCSNSHRLSM